MFIEIPPSHPALPGHFPGAPVVPGAVLLDLTLREIEALHPGQCCREILQLKFLSPVRAGQRLEITLAPARADRLDFSLTHAAHTVLEASIRLAPIAS